MYPLWEKLKGFNVKVSVIDGHNIAAILETLLQRYETLHLIILKTVKGHGVSFMANKMEWHYLPMSEAQYQTALAELELL